jgi:hypothetical protein
MSKYKQLVQYMAQRTTSQQAVSFFLSFFNNYLLVAKKQTKPGEKALAQILSPWGISIAISPMTGDQ